MPSKYAERRRELFWILFLDRVEPTIDITDGRYRWQLEREAAPRDPLVEQPAWYFYSATSYSCSIAADDPLLIEGVDSRLSAEAEQVIVRDREAIADLQPAKSGSFHCSDGISVSSPEPGFREGERLGYLAIMAQVTMAELTLVQ